MNQPITKTYCDGSAHRLGIECRFCSPTRLESHEATCRGLREWWHTLSGEHVRLSVWDWKEACFMERLSWDRVKVAKEHVAAAEARIKTLDSILARLTEGQKA